MQCDSSGKPMGWIRVIRTQSMGTGGKLAPIQKWRAVASFQARPPTRPWSFPTKLSAPPPLLPTRASAALSCWGPAGECARTAPGYPKGSRFAVSTVLSGFFWAPSFQRARIFPQFGAADESIAA
ncbi:hypothetical protein YQE_09833, partial [Dendroctonus ponderosae]